MAAPVEANALFKAALADPADELPRLVFADWLDDIGTADQAAWAHFIRLGTVTHYGPMLPAERHERRAAAAQDVVAKLTLALPDFVAKAAGLLNLLPAANVTVKLANLTMPVAVTSQVWEWTARDQKLLPVEWSGWHPPGPPRAWTERTLVVASARPRELKAKLARDEVRLFGGQVHCVGADAAELQAATDRSYAALREETAVRALLLGFPAESAVADGGPVGSLAVPPVARLIQGIFADAIRERMTMIRMAPQEHGSSIAMRNDRGWRTWNFVPWWLHFDVIAELREWAGLPDLRDGRPGYELGLVRYRHQERAYELPMEIADTPAGPDVTIQVTDPVG
jgi:uncharacterized protein (TIGR02996 family)